MTYPLPFPWFGGKTRAAKLIWDRLGHPPNYVEPFFGGGSVLFNRPTVGSIETINDIDGLVANFWRAVKLNPKATAFYADNPCNEADLHARHRWLITQLTDDFREKLFTDPEFYDPKIAGWWVWGICNWIGQGWCRKVQIQLPHLLGSMGIMRPSTRHTGIYTYFEELANRLQHVRVACGDWSRVVQPAVLKKGRIAAVFLDPPYADMSRDTVYNHDSQCLAHDVYEWAVAHGDDKRLRIACCGYEGNFAFPDAWRCVPWKAHGGHSNYRKQGKNPNKHRECIWFSPHCIHPELF